MRFEVPDPMSVLDLTMSDGAQVRVRRHGVERGPRLILSHGNGFAIDAYFPFWGRFLHDCDVFIFDQRNHGWNARHSAEGHTQAQMADDMQNITYAIEDRYGKRKTAGAFHSLSTVISLLHAKKYGFQWDALILFDPPLAPPPNHSLHEAARKFEFALSAWARQRKHSFENTDELASYFRGTRRTSRWVEGAADLMARSITRPAGRGGVELVCPGPYEAEIYLQNSASQAWQILPDVADKLFVISSDPDAADADPPGQVSRALNLEFGIEVAPVQGTGHLLQIEKSLQVEEIVRHHLHARGFDLTAPTRARQESLRLPGSRRDNG